MVKVGWDAGHGGFKDAEKKIYATPGKRTPDGEPEWIFNDIVGRAFASELAQYEDVATRRFDDPTGKTDVPLKARTDGANGWGADYYISFHHNANTGNWGMWTGVETYIYTAASKASVVLAQAIHPAVVSAYGLRNRGIKRGNFHILRETKMPALLIEGGFMDSRIDINKLRDRTVLENAGRMIAQALAKQIGLKKKDTPSQGGSNMSNVARDTMRIEAINEIKAAVQDGRFTSPHPNVEQYSDEELQNFMLVALARRK